MIINQTDIITLMEKHHVPGVSLSILSNEEIKTYGYGLLEANTAKAVTADSIFSACSMSKFATAMLTLLLAEKGILNLDLDVNRYLKGFKIPENPHTQSEKVTLRRLLSHQAGLKDPDGSFGLYSDAKGLPTTHILITGSTPYYAKPLEIKCPPGSIFEYSDMGYCIVEQVISDVLNQPFDLIMNECVFKPLGMSSSSYILSFKAIPPKSFACGHDKNAYPLDDKYPTYPYAAAAGLWTSSKDMCNLMRELFRAINGASLLGIGRHLAMEILSPQGGVSWAGLGLFLDSPEGFIECSSFGWGSGFQCMLIGYPKLNLGAVIMTNINSEKHQLRSFIGELLPTLAKAYPFPLSL